MPRIDYSFKFPNDVCRFARWQYSHIDIQTSIHTHAFYEVFWVEEGEGVHWINGETRRLYPGLLVLIRREDSHGFSAAKKGGFVRFVNFAFSRELWERFRRHYMMREGGGDEEASGKGGWFLKKDHRKREFDLDASQMERLRIMSHDLELGATDVLSAEAFLAGTIALLNNARSGQETVPVWLSTACRKIQEPEHFRGGVAEFVRLAGRSPGHVTREMQRLFKQKPTDIVNEARMAYAARELSTSPREILDIAADCGIESIGHFYKIFRKRFGVTPHRFRNYAYTAQRIRPVGIRKL